MQWKPIPGFDGHYEASDTGLIRSLDRTITTFSRTGKPYQQLRPGRVLKPGKIGWTKHLHVVLEGRIDRTVHSLILETFVGPCPPGMEALHHDDDPSNNNLSNLSWGTRSENAYDAIRNDRHFNAGITHYKRGHELTPENTQKHSGDNSWGGNRRTCLACRRERRAVYATGARLIPEGFCPNGHPKTPENRMSNGPGRTRCRVCVNEPRRARYSR